ncbi:MAG: hypothetical protein AB3N64_05055 [Puniceicoccaceae bacterium]
MITPLIMLGLLALPLAMAKLAQLAGSDRVNFRTAGALGLVLLFLFTGVGHFIKTEAMAAMIPEAFPSRTALVQATGGLEILLGLAFLFRPLRRFAGLSAIALLLLFLPLNVYAAFAQVPLGGHAWGPLYLAIRIPLQVIILLWAYCFTVRAPE